MGNVTVGRAQATQADLPECVDLGRGLLHRFNHSRITTILSNTLFLPLGSSCGETALILPVPQEEQGGSKAPFAASVMLARHSLFRRLSHARGHMARQSRSFTAEAHGRYSWRETEAMVGQLQAKVWSPEGMAGENVRGSVLALHGWMDNAGSFDVLAPLLARAGYRVAALDLPGHGQTAHRPCGAGFGYNYNDHALAVLEAARALGWPRLTLLGHSMGAGIATLVGGTQATAVLAQEAREAEAAAAAGDGEESFEPGNRGPRAAALQAAEEEDHRVGGDGARRPASWLPALDSVVLVEGLGPVVKPGAAAPNNMLSHLRSRGQLESRKAVGAPRVYESAESAAAARVRTVASHPGNQSLSLEAARALVARGAKPVGDRKGLSSGGGVAFTHDPCVLATHPYWLTEEQACAFLEALGRARVRVLAFRAEHGWPFASGAWEAREQRLRASYGAVAHDGFELEAVAGASHHLHLDPETAPAVAQRVLAFLEAGRMLAF